MIIKQNLAEITWEWQLVESDYERKPRERFLTAVWLEIESQYGTSYAVSLV